MARSAISLHPVALISARIDGEISSGDVRYLETHLADCAACRSKEAGMRSAAIGLRGLPVSDPPQGALDRLLVRLREEPILEVSETREEVPESIVPAISREPFRFPRKILFSGIAAAAGAVAFVWFLGAHAAVTSVSVLTPNPQQPANRSPASAERPLNAATNHLRPTPPQVPATRVAASPLPPAPQLPTETRIAEVASKPLAAPLPAPTSEVARTQPPPELIRAWPDPPPLSFKGDAKRLSREARERVEELADLLRAHPDIHLAIRGYTDERRSSERTLALGQKRAENIARYLCELGVDASRLRTESLAIDRADLDKPGLRERRPEDRVEFAIEPQPSVRVSSLRAQ